MEGIRIQISGPRGRMERYEAAVRGAGGLPVAGFCPQPDLTCGGLLLCGGGDLSPTWYGAEDCGSGPPDRSATGRSWPWSGPIWRRGGPSSGSAGGSRC